MSTLQPQYICRKNTLEQCNVKRDPYIDLDISFCKLWTQILTFRHLFLDLGILIEI